MSRNIFLMVLVLFSPSLIGQEIGRHCFRSKVKAIQGNDEEAKCYFVGDSLSTFQKLTTTNDFVDYIGVSASELKVNCYYDFTGTRIDSMIFSDSKLEIDFFIKFTYADANEPIYQFLRIRKGNELITREIGPNNQVLLMERALLKEFQSIRDYTISYVAERSVYSAFNCLLLFLTVDETGTGIEMIYSDNGEMITITTIEQFEMAKQNNLKPIVSKKCE